MVADRVRERLRVPDIVGETVTVGDNEGVIDAVTEGPLSD